MRFLYFYLMGDQPDAVRAAAPEHAGYWRGMGLANYLGGPFADRSGGLITFDAASLAEAERLVADDPFVQRGLIEQSWLKEWKLD
ncbi:MAG TPA: YciI family protein [Acidimicrobiia bacterium]|nr:YciI family protein [Acidimicrobiia bacterium]